MTVTAALIEAQRILCDAHDVLQGGALLVAGGRIQRVLRSPAAVRRAARAARTRVDLGECILSPGLINAHAHLELSGLAGRLEPGRDFGAWVARIIALRRARSATALAKDARRGADRCLATGTTAVGDIDSTGAGLRGLARHPLRVRVFREVLDAQDPERTAPALARVARALPARERSEEGIAPHAPYSVSPRLLQGVARLAERRALPVSIHWSETETEVRWLRDGSGPLAAILGASPRSSGLDLVEAAGLLNSRTILVHGNHPLRGEPARLAAAGVTLVHCPGSHAWFQRAPFALDRYLRSGVQLALGTDSLASNSDLDMQREMALLRAGHPELDPRDVWSWGTEGGARALGHAGCAGRLQAGFQADLVAWQPAAQSDEPLDALTGGAAGVIAVWIAGRKAWSAPRAARR